MPRRAMAIAVSPLVGGCRGRIRKPFDVVVVKFFVDLLLGQAFPLAVSNLV